MISCNRAWQASSPRTTLATPASPSTSLLPSTWASSQKTCANISSRFRKLHQQLLPTAQQEPTPSPTPPRLYHLPTIRLLRAPTALALARILTPEVAGTAAIGQVAIHGPAASRAATTIHPIVLVGGLAPGRTHLLALRLAHAPHRAVLHQLRDEAMSASRGLLPQRRAGSNERETMDDRRRQQGLRAAVMMVLDEDAVTALFRLQDHLLQDVVIVELLRLRRRRVAVRRCRGVMVVHRIVGKEGVIRALVMRVMEVDPGVELRNEGIRRASG